ncbi:MAG: hypothetical protein NC206_02500 [Bacteroides sp.]|nr:restriction endonuclease [Roseburia sp.]MCM1345933.1 hypothetical protein [Bacteroides sp.]MCM1420297.1 hypothetical protein [Bacteroides sp.]
MNTSIKQYIKDLDLDIRKSGNARFTDQKCVPDVLCAVAECILEYTNEDYNRAFNNVDIWNSPYASELITSSFSKPNLKEETAKHEYDKFFAQPMKLFAAAGILREEKVNGGNVYTIEHRDLLDFIAMRERNACDFLYAYLIKAMTDSGVMGYFDAFFEKQDKASLNDLRNALISLYHRYTPVKNDFEPPRIFNKFINIMAFKRGKRGVERGLLSNGTISIDKIRYNSVNWRDIGKDKRMTRQEYQDTFAHIIDHNEGYYQYQISKAKRFVKSIEPYSEIHRFDCYPASQAHHIFMASEFPTIADCPENIICITPNQHFYRAHPNNHTQQIDRDYQLVCLLSKLDSIEIDFRKGLDNYSLIDFTNVLNIGMNTQAFNPQMNFEEVKYQIMKQAYYQDQRF